MNKELLTEVMTHIDTISYNTFDTGKELWNQGIYIDVELDENGNVCQTSGCFAGWAMVLTMGAKATDSFNGSFVLKGAELLGLTVHQADVLFHTSNTLEDLHFLVDLLISNPDITGVEMYSELRDNQDD